MSTSMSPSVVVSCQNKECERYDQPVSVHLTHLGQDVFAMPALVCGRCWPDRLGLREMKLLVSHETPEQP